MYKKQGGKLYLGPPWDFDGTASISGRGDAGATGIYVADTINQTSAHTASELYYQLYRTPGIFPRGAGALGRAFATDQEIHERHLYH